MRTKLLESVFSIKHPIEEPKMTECSLVEGKTKEKSKAICLSCRFPTCLLESGKSYHVKPCPHCGGRLDWDRDDKEWCCLNCARRSERVSVNNNRVSTADNLVFDAETPISAAKTIPETPISVGPTLPRLKKTSPRETPDTYNWHSLNGAWWAPQEISFRRSQMLFLIKNLSLLREGLWPPNPQGSSYFDFPGVKERKKRYTRGKPSGYFEIPAGIAAEVESRLEQCGLDGLMLEAGGCWGKSKQSLAKSLGIPLWSVQKRANNALRYVSGWKRKKRTYKEFLSHRQSKA